MVIRAAVNQSVRVQRRTVCVTADGDLLTLGDLCLDHGGLLIDKLGDGQDNLEDVFSVNRLAVLEPLSHVVNELLSHNTVFETSAIVAVVNKHVIEIEALGG